MIDKLIKGLSGLGGAAALTTGGIFLKNHVSRVNFLKKYDDKIVDLKNQVVSSDSTINENEIYFPRSDESDEFWEWLWIVEAGSGQWDKNKWTKSDMENREKEFWDTTSQMPSEHKMEVNENYPSYPYWKKYRELCFLWNSVRKADKVNPSGDNNLCFTSYSWKIYKTKDWYKGYEKMKESKEEMPIGEYYWTKWVKFSKKCKTEIEGKNNDSAQILQLFDNWKTNSSTCAIT